jgi:hypothetical protein
MSEHSTDHSRPRTQTPEGGEHEQQHEQRESVSVAPAIEVPRRNLSKGDLNALLDKHEADSKIKDARIERTERMMESLLAQMQPREQQPTVITTNTSQKVPDPSYFCGGAVELDNFLSHLKPNFRLYPQR